MLSVLIMACTAGTVDTSDTAVPEPLACEPREGTPVTVCTVDETGAAVTADQVYWYWSPKDAAYDGEHPMACLDADCTLWALDDAVEGDLYIGARREGPEHVDPYCGYSGYDASPVTVDPDAPVVLELNLELHEYCA